MTPQQAEDMCFLLKTMSHPIRLKILCLLEEKELTVGDLRDQVRTTNANITQHLTLLRQQGVIASRKDGNFIYNRIADRRVVQLIQSMRTLYCSF